MVKWSGGAFITRPTLATQVQQPRQVEHGSTIEQFDTPDERLAAVYSPYAGLARSPADHHRSTTAFNTRLFPQLILEHPNYLTDQQGQTLLSHAKTSVSNREQRQGRRPRPWS